MDNDEQYPSESEQHSQNVSQALIYVLVIVFLIGGAFHWRSKQHTKSIVVKGASYVGSDEILCLIDSSNAHQQSVAKIDLALMQSQVRKHPYVKTASVQRNGIREIEIHVQERKPIALLLQGDGTLKYIDEDGVILDYRLSASTDDLPIISVANFNIQKDTSVKRILLDIVLSLRNKRSEYSLCDVSEILYHPSNGTVTLKTSETGTLVLMGSIYKYEDTLIKLIALSTYFQNQNYTRFSSTIDLRWKDRVILANPA